MSIHGIHGKMNACLNSLSNNKLDCLEEQERPICGANVKTVLVQDTVLHIGSVMNA